MLALGIAVEILFCFVTLSAVEGLFTKQKRLQRKARPEATPQNN